MKRYNVFLATLAVTCQFSYAFAVDLAAGAAIKYQDLTQQARLPRVNPNGKSLAYIQNKKMFRLVNTDTGQLINEFAMPADALQVETIEFSQNGDRVFTYQADIGDLKNSKTQSSTIYIYDLKKQIGLAIRSNSSLDTAAISLSGKSLIYQNSEVAQTRNLTILDLDLLISNALSKNPTAKNFTLTLTPEVVNSYSRYKNLNVAFHAGLNKEIQTHLQCKTGECLSIVTDAGGTVRAFYVDKAEEVNLYKDTSIDGRFIFNPNTSAAGITYLPVQESTKATNVLSGIFNLLTKQNSEFYSVWDLKQEKAIFRLELNDQKNKFISMEISGDNKIITGTSSDYQNSIIRVFNSQAKELVKPIFISGLDGTVVGFTPDNAYMLLEVGSGNFNLISLPTAAPVSTAPAVLKATAKFEGQTYTHTFSSDSKLIALGSYDQTVKIIETTTGQVKSFSFDKSIYSAQFIDNNTKVLVTTYGGEISTIDLLSNKVLNISSNAIGKSQLMDDISVNVNAKLTAVSGDKGIILLKTK